jgi:hypothetical protein
MAKIIEPPPKPDATRDAKQVKRSVRRLEGKSKVDGSEYILNLSLPGTSRQDRPKSVTHGKILSIDVTAALALEGVHAVTGEDVRKLIQIRITVRHFTISRSSLSKKFAMRENPLR